MSTPFSIIPERSSSPSAESDGSLVTLLSFVYEEVVVESPDVGPGVQSKDAAISHPDSEPPACIIRKHERYYFEDRTVKLLVDNTLYNVSRTPLLRHSEWFRQRLEQAPECLPPGWTTLPIPNRSTMFVNHAMEIVQAERPGVSLKDMPEYEGAFHLYGADETEFDALMGVLYPEAYNELNLTIDQWTAVLKLATLWSFLSIRTLAVQRLGQLLATAPLERLILARTYDIYDWIEGACCELIEQDFPSIEEELVRLHVADLAHIAIERESRANARAISDLRTEPLLTKAFENLDTVRRKEKEEKERQAEQKAAEEARVAKERKEAHERQEKERVRRDKDRAQLRKEKEESARKTAAKLAQREAAAEAARKALEERDAADVAESKVKAERELAEVLERKVKAARELAELNTRSQGAMSEWAQFAAFFSGLGDGKSRSPAPPVPAGLA